MSSVSGLLRLVPRIVGSLDDSGSGETVQFRNPRATSHPNTAIATIRTNLPFLLTLTNEERRSLPKLGDNRLALDEDGWSLMGSNPDLIPVFVVPAELGKDRTLRAQLDDIRLQLGTLFNDVESTELVLGSEMLTAYLAFYANAQQVAKRGVAGAQAVVDVLKKYFARPGRPAPPPTPPNP